MLKLDTLNQLKQLKKNIKDSRNIAEGTVKGSTHKFGFVSLDVGKDVYLPPDEMEKVLPGDRVEVEIIKDAKNKKVAKIERLISTPTKTFCGKYITKGKAHFIEPDIPGMNRWFFVPPQKRKNSQAKDLVKCRVTQHPFKTGNAQAAVVEIIGTEQDIGIEREYAIHKYDTPKQWNTAIETQLEALNEASIEEKKSGRSDYTHLPFITVDAKSTVDIDDALYAEENDLGWMLYVAIADPCALIPAGSEIENEALRRATSIYFPGLQIPMLPEKLAGDLCSLREGHDRLAKVLKIQVLKDGKLGEFKLENAFVRSRNKMSYTELSELLSSTNTSDELIEEPVKAMLPALQSATDSLQNERQNSALVHPERIEFTFELNEQQKISEITKKTFTIAHQIVEESMVTANRCIAKLLAESEQESIFIQHLGVRNDRLEGLQQVISERLDQYKNSDISNFSDFVDIMKHVSSIEEIEADEAEKRETFRLLISRQLEKSSLSSKAAPHFGMGLEQYTTFTSPLSKAQDLLVHRQLDSIIGGNAAAIDPAKLSVIESATTHARGAVYDVEQWLKCQYMSRNKNVLEARVQRTFSTGFHVRLVENGIEGFISTKEMDGKYSFNQSLLKLTGKDASYELDKLVHVQLKQVDWSRKQLQFEIVPETDTESLSTEPESAQS